MTQKVQATVEAVRFTVQEAVGAKPPVEILAHALRLNGRFLSTEDFFAMPLSHAIDAVGHLVTAPVELLGRVLHAEAGTDEWVILREGDRISRALVRLEDPPAALAVLQALTPLFLDLE